MSGEVVVTWVNFDPDDLDTGGVLTESGLDIRLAPKLGQRTESDVADLVGDAVGAIVSTDPFDAAVFAAAPRLRVIARVGVGTDSIDIEAATAAGVAVTITSGANSETTADHTLALMLAVLRRARENDQSVRRGEWNRAGDLTPDELHRSVVGIVGYGQIGRAVARRLSGFDVRLLVADPQLSGVTDVELVSLEELLVRADVVSLHAPLIDSTRGLIGERELGQMRSNSILVNTSRGGLVDERALVKALRAGTLRGAGLDVFEDEPPTNSTLLALPNVLLSPHIGGLSHCSIAAMTRRAARSVVDVLANRANEAVINPTALEHRHDREGAASPLGLKEPRRDLRSR